MKYCFSLLAFLIVSFNVNGQKVLRPSYKAIINEIKLHETSIVERRTYTVPTTEEGFWISYGAPLRIAHACNKQKLYLANPEQANSVAYILYQINSLNVDKGFLTLSGEIRTNNNEVQIQTMQDSVAVCTFGKSTEWKCFKLTNVYENCERFHKKDFDIAIQFMGADTLELRNLSLQFNGEDLDKICPLPKANMDNEFDLSSHFSFKAPLTKVQTECLRTLCLVWGYLKYNHSNVMEGDYDWNYELFRFLPLIYTTENYKQFCHNVLVKLPANISQKTTPKALDADVVIASLQFEWMADLPKSLRRYISAVNNTGKYNYAVSYMTAHPGECVVKFNNETTYPQITYKDDGYRLLCLFRFWNMIYYFHPYMYLKEQEWLNLLPRYIEAFCSMKTELEFEDTLVKLVSELKDSHSEFYALKSRLLSTRGNGPWGDMYLPMNVKLRNNKLIITSFMSDKMKDTGLQIGDEIISINGNSVSEIYKKKSVYSPVFNPNSDPYAMAYQSFNGNDVNIEIIRDKKKYNINIQDVLSIWGSNSPTNNVYKITHKDYNGVYYVDLSAFSGNDLNELLSKLHTYKKIIFDCRGYRYDESIAAVLSQFLYDKPLSPFYTSYIDIASPGMVLKNQRLPIYGKNNTNSYQGKVYALVDGDTMSFSEWLACIIKKHPNGYICGSPTAGVLGRVAPIPLMSGISTCITGYGVYMRDGCCTFPHGVPIDIVLDEELIGEDAVNELLRLCK